jgi:hypothetical protein
LILIVFYIFTGEENFLKKVFLSPNPHLSKALKRGGYFFVKINALDGRANNVRTALERLLLEERLPTEEGGEV